MSFWSSVLRGITFDNVLDVYISTLSVESRLEGSLDNVNLIRCIFDKSVRSDAITHE